MEEKQKPFILEMEEAKLELVQVINKAIQVRKLPCYLLLPIIENIYKDMQIGAQNELAMARQQMESEEVA
jgi:UDP-N-acetyl-D-mannosaminuronate dehydrogenase